jgi:hypothetical protein
LFAEPLWGECQALPQSFTVKKRAELGSMGVNLKNHLRITENRKPTKNVCLVGIAF